MISHGKDIKIFTGNANPKLAADICKIIGTKLGESEVKSFADGEASVSLYETVRGMCRRLPDACTPAHPTSRPRSRRRWRKCAPGVPVVMMDGRWFAPVKKLYALLSA